jgi:DNA invertase Pin-like site-specific DNA recombinase
MSTPVIAIGYVRRSAKPRKAMPGGKDERDGTASLEVQRAAIEGYCQAEGWVLAEIIEHNGVSGGKRRRFDELDTALERHGATRVVAYHLDRVGRDVGGVLDWLAGASRRGIDLHVVGRGRVHTTSSSDFLATGVEALVADHFRRVVSEKTRDALARLRTTGRRYCNIPPYGYQRALGGRLAVHPREQAVLGEIAALSAQKHSLRVISRTLATRGVLARNGRAFTPAVLGRLVRRAVSDRAISDTAAAG